MAERRYYRVAEHVFAIQLPEGCDLPLGNYEPFLIPEQEALTLDCRFCLQLTDDKIEDMPHHNLFTDATETDMPRIEVNKTDNGWLIAVSMYKETPTVFYLFISADYSDVRMHVLQQNKMSFAINNAAMLTYAFSTVQYHTLEMHAAVVVKDDRGYLFLGKSGTGKSTHARQWLKAFSDAWLLNDDNPILRLQEEDGKPVLRVYGSPWSGKTPCYINRQAVVGGIVKLDQAPHNEAQPLRLPEAYAYMLSSASGLKIDPVAMDALYDTISQMITLQPLYHLDCLPDTDAAQVCFKAVKQQ
ncbi:MAG: hypothetical protein IJS00_06415 [Paludibacteraceae bacterium]|nr:hypothetical protein [Paludibacteraceae bacterium]